MINGLKQHGIQGDGPANDDDTFKQTASRQRITRQLWKISGGLRELRADRLGGVTPLRVWPHGFDASQLWFPGGDPDEHN
ncbi:MAG: hypothetical protein IPK19_24620 [Chloroflexi bacterium]|nr:hypothetical protein [Chloroflexota bacterium]